MVRTAIIASILLAGCTPATEQKTTKVNRAVLIIHGGGVVSFSREYEQMTDCAIARSIVLEDNARRAKLSLDITKKYNVALSSESTPSAICLTT